MTNNVLILGASGSIARVAIDLFLEESDAQLTLYLRHARKVKIADPARERVIEGNVLDTNKLTDAMAGQDVVYANLAGDLERKSVAALIVKLALSPELEIRHSLGLSKPEHHRGEADGSHGNVRRGARAGQGVTRETM